MFELNPYLLFLMGAILLYYSSELLVSNSILISEKFNIPRILIGGTIIALGTSLPEIVSCVIASSRGHGDLSIGNAYGSNIFNIHMVLGIASIIQPLKVQERIEPDLIIATVLSCMLAALLRLNTKLSKKNGFSLLVIYLGYISGKSLKLI